MSRLRPFSLTIFAVTLFFIVMWYESSEMKYDIGAGGSGRTTGAWFTLGFPIVIVMAIVASLPFSWLARRTNPIAAWLTMVAVLGGFLFSSVESSSPAAKLNRALRFNAPSETRIERLHELSSFGDGPSYSGIIVVEPEFVESLKTDHSMRPSSSSLLDDLVPMAANAAQTLGYSGNGLSFYYDADDRRLYFRRAFQSSPR